MMRFSLTLAVALLAAGCPQPPPADTTGSPTSATASTSSTTTIPTSGTDANPTTSISATTSTTSVTTSTSSTTTDGTTTGNTSDATSSTGGDTFETTSEIDIGCTYPGSTSLGPETPDLAPECACIDDQGNLTCASSLCPLLIGNCRGGGIFDETCSGTWTYDEAALDCALVAARDGTEGTISWSFTPNSGYSGHNGFLHIVAGRRAIRQDFSWVDLGGPVSDTELWQLKGPEYFEGCIGLPTFCDRLHCFFAGTDGPALSQCLPGFYKGGL